MANVVQCDACGAAPLPHEESGSWYRNRCALDVCAKCEAKLTLKQAGAILAKLARRGTSVP